MRKDSDMRRVMATWAGTALAASALAGCGGDTDEPGVAHLDATGADSAATAEAGSAEEQALAFAQCMRDNGVDFPDPTVDADGNPSFEGAFGRSEEGGFDPADTDFRDAMEACGDLMEGLVMGGPGGTSLDADAITEGLYQYTSCLREQGLDVGDITLDVMMPGGQGGPPDAADSPTAAPGELPDGPPQGVQGGAVDPSDRFAEQLGQDPESPEWIAANEACQDTLDAVFSGAGFPGGPGGNG